MRPCPADDATGGVEKLPHIDEVGSGIMPWSARLDPTRLGIHRAIPEPSSLLTESGAYPRYVVFETLKTPCFKAEAGASSHSQRRR
jgi:hypothetical protein